MTDKGKATNKTKTKRLTLKKETLKNLDVKNKDKDVKGGMARQRMGTASCLSCEEFGCR